MIQTRTTLTVAFLLAIVLAPAPSAAFDWIPPRPVTALLPGACLAPSSAHTLALSIAASGAPASLTWSATSSGQFGVGVNPSAGSILVPAGTVGTVNLTVTLPDTANGVSVLSVVLLHAVGGSQAAKAAATIQAATGGRPEVKPVPAVLAAAAGVAGSVSFQVHSLIGVSEQIALTAGRFNPDPNNEGALFPGSPPPTLATLPAGGTITISAPTTIASNAYAGNVNAVQLSVTSDGGISNAQGHALSTASGTVPTALVPAGVLTGDDAVVGRDGAAFLASRNQWLIPTGLTGVRAVWDVSTDSVGPVDSGGDGSDDRWIGTIRIPSYAAAIAVVPRFARAPGDTVDIGLCAAGRAGLMLLDLTVTEDPTFGTWEDFFDVDMNGIDDRILRTIPVSGFATDAAWFRTSSGRVVALVADADSGSVPVSSSYNPAAVVAGTGQGVVAIDLGAALDPLQPPYAAGTLATPGSTLDLELRGGSAPDLAIADGIGGVAVYSLLASGGAPAAVTFNLRGTVALSSAWGTPYARDLAWVSNTKDSVYVACAAGAGGVQIVRVPRGGAAPTLVLSQQTLAPTIGVAGTWTGTLAAAMGTSGLALLRSPGAAYLDRIVTGASSPYTPPVTLARLAPWAATGVALEVAAHQTPLSGISAATFKPSTGPLPTLLASDGARLLALRPGNAAITAVEIDPTSPPSAPSLAVSPNPARGRARIEVRARWGAGASSSGHPALGRFAVDIFDVNGRKVRRLDGDGAGAPRGSVEWDGRDANGRRVASGRYWVRSSTREEMAVPLILLR